MTQTSKEGDECGGDERRTHYTIQETVRTKRAVQKEESIRVVRWGEHGDGLVARCEVRTLAYNRISEKPTKACFVRVDFFVEGQRVGAGR